MIFALPISVLFTWFYLRCKGSILVAVLLHASVNMLSDIGFSKYETSMVIFLILMTSAAVIVALSSPVFRSRSRTAANGA